MAKKRAIAAFLAGLSSLFLLGCYSGASSSEEEISSNSDQGSSSDSLASSESYSESVSSSTPSAIYDGFTLTQVIQFDVDDSADGLEKEAHLYIYAIEMRLSSFSVEF